MTAETGTTCMVCRLGEIIQDSYQDLHCNTCDLKYRFLPSKTPSPPKSDSSIVQIQPGLFKVRKSTSIFSKDR